MKTTAIFSLDSKRIEISVEYRNSRISFTGIGADGSSGQILDEISALYDESLAYIPELETIITSWQEFHLKANAPIPFENLQSAIAALDGRRFPEESEGGKADDFEDAEFSNKDDIIDSRTVINRIEYLEDFLSDLSDENKTKEMYDPEEDANGDRSEAVEELVSLRNLESQGESYSSDWRHGETLIHDDYFNEYAEELVKDIGDMPNEIPSYIVIDWEATAQNIKQDYTCVTFSGETYWIR